MLVIRNRQIQILRFTNNTIKDDDSHLINSVISNNSNASFDIDNKAFV